MSESVELRPWLDGNIPAGRGPGNLLSLGRADVEVRFIELVGEGSGRAYYPADSSNEIVAPVMEGKYFADAICPALLGSDGRIAAIYPPLTWPEGGDPLLVGDAEADRARVERLQEEKNERFEAASDAFDEFVPGVNQELADLQDRADQVTQEMLAEKDRVNAELGPAKADLSTLKTTTIPALQTTLDAANAEVSTLKNTTIPALQTTLNTNTTKVNTLQNTTIPALQTTLDTTAGKVTTLENTTIPGLQSTLTATKTTADKAAADLLTEKARVNAELGPVKTDLSTLKTTTIPNLQTALTNVEGVAQSADKRSTVSTAAPSATSGYPSGAVWQRINASGAVIGSWRLSGSSWVQMPLDPVVIPNLSAGIITSGVLNTNRLNASEVAAAVGSFLSVNTGQITWDNAAGNNAFIGNLVGEQAFLTNLYSQRVVVSPDNMIRDPGFADVTINAARISMSTGAWFVSDNISDADMPTCFRINSAGAADQRLLLIDGPYSDSEPYPSMPVAAGTKIRFSCGVRTYAGVSYQIVAYIVRADGTRGSSGFSPSFTHATTGRADVSYEWTVPTDAVRAFMVFRVLSTGATGSYLMVGKPKMTPMVGTTLIENGAVTADQVNAQSVAGAVGSFLSLSAGQITSGTIDTGRLNAQSVAGAVGSFLELNAGQITSGKINTDRLTASEVAAAVANVISLNASRITAGTINTDRLDAQTIAARVAEFLSIKTGQIAWDNAAGNNAFIGNLVNEQLFTERMLAAQIAVTASNMIPWAPSQRVAPAVNVSTGATLDALNDSLYGWALCSTGGSGTNGTLSSCFRPDSGYTTAGISGAYPVEEMKPYYFGGLFGRRGAIPAGMTAIWVRLVIQWFNKDGGLISSSYLANTNLGAIGAVVTAEGTVNAPAGAVAARLFVQKDFWDTATLLATSITFKPAVRAVLIENGAVSADKLAAKIALVTRLIAGPEDGYHVELNQTGIKFRSKLAGVTNPVEILKINTPGTDSDGDVFTLLNPNDLSESTMSINEAGQTSTSDLTVSNLTQLQDVAIRGRTFEDYLDTLPRGVVAWGEGLVAASRTIAALTTVTLGTINFVAEPGRMYRVVATGPSVQASVASTVSVRLEIAGSAGSQYGWLGAGWNKADMTRVYDASSLAVETQTTVAYLIGAAAGGSAVTHPSYRNLAIVVEDIGPAVEADISLAVSQTGEAPVVPAKKQYTKTWATAWLRTFPTNSFYARKATQGTWNGTTYRGFLGFPNMVADIGSAEIVKIEAYIYMSHWYYNAGGTLSIQGHGAFLEPTAQPSVSGSIVSLKTGKPGGGWVTLPSSYHAGFKAGTLRGIALVGSGLAAYGYATSGQIRVTYKK